MKNWGYVVTSLLIAMLGVGIVQTALRITPGQGGGGDVCLCPSPMVITATFQMVISPTPIDGSTVTPTASSTPRPTPSKVPILPSHTPNLAECPGYPMAAEVKGMSYTVTKVYRQYIRNIPDSSSGKTVIGYLYENKPRHVWYTFNGWLSLNIGCSEWIWSGYGELYPESTE